MTQDTRTLYKQAPSGAERIHTPMAHNTLEIAKAIEEQVTAPITKEALMTVMGVASHDKYKDILRKLAVSRHHAVVVVEDKDGLLSVDAKVSATVRKAMNALNRVQPLGEFGGGVRDKTKTKAYAKKKERARKLQAQLAALKADLGDEGMPDAPGTDSPNAK